MTKTRKRLADALFRSGEKFTDQWLEAAEAELEAYERLKSQGMNPADAWIHLQND